MKLIDRVNNLKVRSKLGLFLFIPVLTILFFSITSTYQRYQELQDTRNTKKFIAISLLLADLAYELQKERGLSAGFVGSKGHQFQMEVLIQRKLTNDKLQQFLQILETKQSKNNYWGLSEEFELLKTELTKLPAIRSAIDTLEKGNFFNYYSDLNTNSLHIIQFLQVLTNDATLARYGDAFSTLLRLQERSGQERGTLNGVFSSGIIAIQQIQELSSFRADKDTLFSNFYTVAPKQFQSMLKEKMDHPVVNEVEALRSAAMNKITKNDLLMSLQILVGYGGLIHDFKNYVLRGKRLYIDNFESLYADAMQVLDKYQNLPQISPQEIDDLNILRVTFKKYYELIYQVASMRKQGLSAQEIDPIVKVDDKPALEAIKNLRNHMTTMDTNNWWSIATFRLELIKQVSDAIRTAIVKQVEQTLKKARNALIFNIMITVLSLLISFFIAYHLIKRIVNELENISGAMHKMLISGDFDQTLNVTGNDEISKMANAFNNLINERKKSQAMLKLAEENEHQLQIQLLQVQKMESLGHLTGGIAHDFNNILGIILGYTELAINAVRPEQHKQQEHLQQVYKAAERAKELVSQMLAFSRGEKEIKLETVPLSEVLSESIELLRPFLPSSIEISTDIDPYINDVMADQTKIHQVIMNLCINARDAISEHGHIKVKLLATSHDNAICTSCHQTFSGRFVELSVEDTGAGIHLAHMDSLFDPFFSTKQPSKGTGMGLAIVHGIIHSHDGHIVVDTVPGMGSTFKLLFPQRNLVPQTSIAPLSEAVDTSNHANHSTTSKHNILIVDDEQSLASFMKDALESNDHKVTTFTDSSLALEHFKEHPDSYHLLITDQTMPKITGAEMAKEILELRPELPIILCSGYSDCINEHLSRDIGIRTYMKKPIKLNDLLNNIKQLLE